MEQEALLKQLQPAKSWKLVNLSLKELKNLKHQESIQALATTTATKVEQLKLLVLKPYFLKKNLFQT